MAFAPPIQPLLAAVFAETAPGTHTWLYYGTSPLSGAAPTLPPSESDVLRACPPATCLSAVGAHALAQGAVPCVDDVKLHAAATVTELRAATAAAATLLRGPAPPPTAMYRASQRAALALQRTVRAVVVDSSTMGTAAWYLPADATATVAALELDATALASEDISVRMPLVVRLEGLLKGLGRAHAALLQCEAVETSTGPDPAVLAINTSLPWAARSAVAAEMSVLDACAFLSTYFAPLLRPEAEAASPDDPAPGPYGCIVVDALCTAAAAPRSEVVRALHMSALAGGAFALEAMIGCDVSCTTAPLGVLLPALAGPAPESALRTVTTATYSGGPAAVEFPADAWAETPWVPVVRASGDVLRLAQPDGPAAIVVAPRLQHHTGAGPAERAVFEDWFGMAPPLSGAAARRARAAAPKHVIDAPLATNAVLLCGTTPTAEAVTEAVQRAAALHPVLMSPAGPARRQELMFALAAATALAEAELVTEAGPAIPGATVDERARALAHGIAAMWAAGRPPRPTDRGAKTQQAITPDSAG